MLLGFEQEDILQRLNLGSLDRAESAELAAAMVGEQPPEALVRWLDERSLGNPLFSIGLLQALLDEGADLASPALQHLPEGLAERVMSRLKTQYPRLGAHWAGQQAITFAIAVQNSCHRSGATRPA